jgi:exodeoxyribonuclease V alpha subunit
LYTAITRAKRGVVLVGDMRGLKRAVSNRTADKRNTSLTRRLDGTIEPADGDADTSEHVP